MTTISVHEEQTDKGEETGKAPSRLCSYCGQPSGSISKGTGRPLVVNRQTGEAYHVNCKPGVGIAALVRMGG